MLFIDGTLINKLAGVELFYVWKREKEENIY
jgi:hypothetical protein